MDKNILEISLGGKDYSLQFSMGFAEVLEDEFGIDVTDIGANLQEKISTPLKLARFVKGLVWSGIANYHRANKIKLEVPKDEIMDALSSLMPDDAAQISVKVIEWLFKCLEIPVEITNTSEGGEVSEKDRFHLAKVKTVRPRRNGAKGK